ncbi:MAG: serine/threonine-protein kinase [Polyangiaceae bacterium]
MTSSRGRRSGSTPGRGTATGRKLVGKFLGDGKYRIRSIIGSGGNGMVYEADDLVLKRLVAIKVPSMGDTEMIKRFLREGRAGAAVVHENVCSLYDFGKLDDGTPFLVLERLLGHTLDHHLEAGKMPLRSAIDLLVQVLAGLGAAHTRGITHRDMKPANIFIVQLSGTAKILDFGTSKLSSSHFDEEDELETLTQIGFAVGTPYYMAPEQAQGFRDVDGRVDLYACGVLLYELVTAHKPFDAKTAKELFGLIVSGRFVPAREYAPELHADVDVVIARAIARDYRRRFPTAEEFSAALDRLKEHAPLLPSASPSTAPDARIAHLQQRFHELTVLHRATQLKEFRAAKAKKSGRTPSKTPGPSVAPPADGLRDTDDSIPIKRRPL